ncbi:hypothetical protein LTR10_018868 [Elasticomyces elasticus]|uniref:Ornithine aminotransferase n=1 Tax=Exophiala sideris TaxID=1016849 RepID=A0ABR0IWL0_9EURO|nr:hypothetical protein LTR10_018868 [Elasticomyces elasticus]KAK5021667.1 hypothetical protein LTS07_010838 [Exophiala sideris]KAK5049805.1 hypothetical protein LTR69_010862 [Exophiala sideris]KAK5176786.1 hypothetical protein LTR44_010729 [Eurotiomycetes sp. CCFEE 6388]
MPSAIQSFAVSDKTQEALTDYREHVAGGFAPLPVAIVRAKNAAVWDVDGKEYLDFLSMYSVVNMGHGHPRPVSAAIEAMKEAGCVNIAFHNPLYGKLAKRLHEA